MEILAIFLLFLIGGIFLLKFMQNSQKSELNFKLIFDNVSDGILVAEVQSLKFLMGNQKICKMLGYSLGELKKLNVKDIHPEEHLPRIVEQFEQLSKQEITIAKDIPIKRKEGSIFYVDISSSPKITLGKKEYLIGIFRDITERKMMEEILKESEELHRTTLSEILEAVFITDDNGQFTFICSNVHNIFGYSHAEVQTMGHIAKLFGKTLATAQLLHEQGQIVLEQKIIDKFGNSHVLQISIKLVSIKKGTILYTCTDITERKRIEEALAHRLAIEQTIATISTNFINVAPDALDQEIERALQIIGTFTKVERSYILKISEDSQHIENTNQWCMSGITSQIDFQDLLIDSLPWICTKLKNLEIVHIPRVAEMPAKAKIEKAILQRQQIQSLIIVPMTYAGILVGCLGFDSVTSEKTWQEEDILFLKTMADIFANALIHQQMNEKFQQFYRAVEQSANSIVITDKQGNIEYVNPKFTQLTGYNLEETLGQNPRILKSGKTPSFTYQQLWKTINNGQEWRGEFYNKKKNGNFYWEFAAISPLRNSVGIITHFLGIKEDITERKQVEEALRKEKDKIRTYLDIAEVIFVTIDADQRISLINQKGCEILGYSEAEIIGKNWFDHFIQKPDKETIKAIFTKIMQGQLAELEYVENSIVTQQGEERIIAWHNTILTDEEGKITGTLSSGQDITQRKQVEQALLQEQALLARRVEERTAELSRANSELARASRLKDEFLANMSHELRTPLNAILAFSGTLQEQLLDSLTKKQINYLQNIEKSGQHLLNLINDILDLSKIEAGKMDLIIEPIFVKEVCQSSLNFVKQLASKKHLKIVLDLESTIVDFYGDNLRLKQILVNLLSNAIKFTPDGGKLGLMVVSEPKKEVVLFTVWDTGIGIAEADMTKLFQSFVQIDSGLSRRYEGTGLGLALVRRLTEMHGGSISVASEVDKGSHFTVSLPWRKSANPETRSPTIESQETKMKATTQVITNPTSITGINIDKPIILLAENDENSICSMSEYLSLKQYEVIVARTGVEAIECASKKIPNLILINTQMPVIDGLEVIQNIRAHQNLATVPIIVLTALAMPGDRERYLAIGANEYLNNPISLQNLSQIIEQQLNGVVSSKEKDGKK